MSDKFISADKLIEDIVNRDNGTMDISIITIDSLLSRIDNMPPADVAEVVRCKDCKYYYEGHYENADELPYIKHTCTVFHRQIKLDDYCSYGVRK